MSQFWTGFMMVMTAQTLGMFVAVLILWAIFAAVSLLLIGWVQSSKWPWR